MDIKTILLLKVVDSTERLITSKRLEPLTLNGNIAVIGLDIRDLGFASEI